MNILDLTDPADRILPKVLHLQAQQNGGADFLITDDRRIIFAEADAQSDRLAGGLRDLGVEKGDRVVLFMLNCPEVVLLSLAVNKLGALWTPINTDYKGEWLLDTLQRSRAKVLVTDAALHERIAGIENKLDCEHMVLLADQATNALATAVDYQTLLASEPLSPDYKKFHYGDSNAILWTSGTTGKSKGVLQSHNNWIRAIEGASIQFASQPGDSIYSPLPLYNTAAWITAIYRGMYEGIPVAIESKFSVSNFMRRIRQFNATQTFVIGAMGVFLWNTPEQPNDADIPLRVAGITPMPPDIWEAFEQRFGLRILRTGFGMSEVQSVMNQIDCGDEIPKNSMGLPNHDLEVRLFDEEGVEVEAGQPGEMCVRELQPHVLFNGYFDNPAATKAAHRGEWFLTGDMVRKDPETGTYFFLDRKKDSVRFAGRNISTMEVENVVRKHPQLADVAAFGVPSAEISSEDELALSVVLQADSSLTEEALCGFINDNAPHFFVPRYINKVSALPYTPTNKVQKYKLREQGVTGDTWDRKQSDYKVRR